MPKNLLSKALATVPGNPEEYVRKNFKELKERLIKYILINKRWLINLILS